MELTPENKKHIDSLTYYELLSHHRKAPIGDEWFTGGTGVYWGERMAELRDQDPAAAVETSKTIGFNHEN